MSHVSIFGIFHSARTKTPQQHWIWVSLSSGKYITQATFHCSDINQEICPRILHFLVNIFPLTPPYYCTSTLHWITFRTMSFTCTITLLAKKERLSSSLSILFTLLGVFQQFPMLLLFSQNSKQLSCTATFNQIEQKTKLTLHWLRYLILIFFCKNLVSCFMKRWKSSLIEEFSNRI